MVQGRGPNASPVFYVGRDDLENWRYNDIYILFDFMFGFGGIAEPFLLELSLNSPYLL